MLLVLVLGLMLFLGGEVLDLVEGCTEGGVLYAELVDEGATLFPSAVCFVCGCEGGVEEGRAGFEGLDVPGGDERGFRGEQGTHWSRRSRKARCALRFCSARLVELRARWEAEGGGDWDGGSWSWTPGWGMPAGGMPPGV